MVEASAKKSDLGIRILSAIVMIAVAGTALWLGGWALTAFVVALGLGLLIEFWGLVRRIRRSFGPRFLWMLFGAAYIGAACWSILQVPQGIRWLIIVAVIAVDSFAYFAGRAIGGPKIAPAISPSKTWAGLFGGIVGASIVLSGFWLLILYALSGMDAQAPSFQRAIISPLPFVLAIGAGAVVAVLAQAGDFFESWMKRRAGVKDSGALIPGHGGLFDRVDGLIPVAIAAGLINLGGYF